MILHANDFSFPRDLYAWDNFSGAALKILSNPGASFKHQTGEHVYYVSSRFFPEFKLTLVILKKGDAQRDEFIQRLRINLAIGVLITGLIVIAVSLILRSYNRKLERLASSDSLTGAYNRHALALIFLQALKS